jgi:hypothetical protein
MIALFCALAIVPGVVHARVCLVAIGAIEQSDCCPARTCCEQEPSDGPTLSSDDQDCHCCLEFHLDSSERPLPASLPSTTELPPLAPAFASGILQHLEPPAGLEIAERKLARAGPRPRAAAPLPLRI